MQLTSSVGSLEVKRLLSPIFQRLARAVGVLEIQTRLDYLLHDLPRLENQEVALAQYIDRRLDHLREYVDAMHSHVMTHVDTITLERDNAIQESMMSEMIRHTDKMAAATLDKLGEATAQVKREVDRIRSVATRSLSGEPKVNSEIAVAPIDESMYIALEDHFRGDPKTIKERQSGYISYVRDCVNDDYPLLDIGFGRGEWLELLRDNGISASGIDTNSVSVEEALAKGLDVAHADISDYLAQLPDHSLGAVTLFQVFEHLPFAVVVESLRSILRVLRPGGTLIAEIPNCESLSVGASTFWIDPTHQRPLFPGVLRFVASEVGYSHVDGLYSSPVAPAPDLVDLSELTRKTILDLHHRLYGPGDFALIARA